MTPQEQFAVLTGNPLQSPLEGTGLPSLNVPEPPAPARPPVVLPNTSASFPPDGFRGGVDPEFDYFPDLPHGNSLASFVPSIIGEPGGTGDPARGAGGDGGGGPGSASAPSPAESVGGFAAALKMLRNHGIYDDVSGIRNTSAKLGQKLLKKKGFDEDVQAHVGRISDNLDRGRHTGGQITGADETVQSGREATTPTLEGEYVMTRQAVEMFGLDTLEEMNRMAAGEMGQDPQAGPAPNPVDEFSQMVG